MAYIGKFQGPKPTITRVSLLLGQAKVTIIGISDEEGRVVLVFEVKRMLDARLRDEVG